MMARTITVKGTGKATVKPDQVVIRMDFSAKDMHYEQAMAIAARQITVLKYFLANAGFGKDALKTTDVRVRTNYDYIGGENTTCFSVFAGYECSQSAKLTIDWNPARLSAALSAIAKSTLNPTMHIDFTVKNPSAVSEMILQDATRNAQHKAEILCATSGAKLGKLLDIHYSWGELELYSQTRYSAMECMDICCEPGQLDITPDDIQVDDTATFVWKIR